MAIHIGKKIAEIIELRKMTRAELGRAIGVKGSAATYLTTRESIDVGTLAKIGEVLKYNFFKHYPITEAGDAPKEPDEREKKIAELEKELDECKRDFMLRENGYLKKINELLQKKV